MYKYKLLIYAIIASACLSIPIASSSRENSREVERIVYSPAVDKLCHKLCFFLDKESKKKEEPHCFNIAL